MVIFPFCIMVKSAFSFPHIFLRALNGCFIGIDYIIVLMWFIYFRIFGGEFKPSLVTCFHSKADFITCKSKTQLYYIIFCKRNLILILHCQPHAVRFDLNLYSVSRLYVRFCDFYIISVSPLEKSKKKCA